ncbi:MAG: TetR family transcriptional regulator [Sphingomonas sp.]|uniref:TetR/AcrR family transcriptional regulator n=1 Tax=Sphingomonas sp. TaxID=28214 RepID=UPI0026365443|nr:TetR family transcriptional regulator [Sphingomonas sp.]MDK2768108.1 TetR family transcriptional regulator [Sphingomonas sp.]
MKSQLTRDRIAVAARKIFSAQGFDRATIRAIAEEANIHASMVMRYFGSKEALFATVVRFDLRLPDLTTIPSSELGEALVRHFLERWEDGGGGELAALLRAAVTHPIARARMVSIFEDQLAAALRQTGDQATAPQRAALIASQMLGLAMTRYVLGFASARAMDRETIVKRLAMTIQAYLQ